MEMGEKKWTGPGRGKKKVMGGKNQGLEGKGVKTCHQKSDPKFVWRGKKKLVKKARGDMDRTTEKRAE